VEDGRAEDKGLTGGQKGIGGNGDDGAAVNEKWLGLTHVTLVDCERMSFVCIKANVAFVDF
jgi:hypothetical protein